MQAYPNKKVIIYSHKLLVTENKLKRQGEILHGSRKTQWEKY